MSFQQGISGLNSTAKSLDVIGNNIANVSTVGSKTARAEFADMYAASGGGSGAAGLGAKIAAVAQQFGQGSIKATDNSMDVAISGNGFFELTDGKGIVYSRNGQFKMDRDGFIVNNSALKLMGYPVDAGGVVQPGAAVALQLPTGGVSPAVTANASVQANFDSRAANTGDPLAPVIDFNDPRTYNNATSMIAYDIKGQEVALTYFFQKVDTDTWNLYASANGVDVTGGAPVPINFAPDGSAPAAPLGAVTLNVPITTNTAGAATVAFDMDLDVSGLTQFGSAFGVSDLKQDGFASGLLTSIGIESNGVVMARYSNGQTRPAGQIELATFRNPQGLSPLGDNTWASSFASGQPLGGAPGSGAAGLLQSSAVEESNVDLTAELVNMMVAQRIYQANSQTIKTQDQVLQTLVNLR